MNFRLVIQSRSNHADRVYYGTDHCYILQWRDDYRAPWRTAPIIDFNLLPKEERDAIVEQLVGVEVELAEDKRIYGNCFWRFDECGKKIRVDPTFVQVAPYGSVPRYFVNFQSWEVFGG
jgi:hypothetical protein